MMLAMAAGGALWAARRFGWMNGALSNRSAWQTGSLDRARERGETIFRNTPRPSPELSHLGASGNI